MKQIKNKESGFTLIEILVAMLLLSVALLSMVSMTIITYKANYAAEIRAEATNTAISILNEYEFNLPAATITGQPKKNGFDWEINPTHISADEINLNVIVTWNDHAKVKTISVNRLVTTYTGL